MKKSSIEKLHEESSKLIHQFFKGHLSSRELITMHHNLYYDSKEMHKQELESTYNHAMWALMDTGHGESFEEYYKNTYEKD